MIARTSKSPSRGHSKRSKAALLLVAIFLLALPLFAVANSTALQLAFQPVQAAFQSPATLADDGFVANQAPAAATSGFSPFSSSGIRPEAQTISAGWNHSLVIKSDGTLWSWGFNGSGKTGLGIPTYSTQLVPAQVGTATDWTAVSAGQFHSLAVRSDGTLWAWGSNANGRT
ncbi:MAG: hypothetical protein FWF11_04985, partial [Coriobacteriia bacterium]|nr:hypothetical protein [Coriobacteriia bacterium]